MGIRAARSQLLRTRGLNPSPSLPSTSAVGPIRSSAARGRSACALGAHGLIIPKDRAAGVTPAVAKASAGAVERCPVVRVTNVARTIDSLKEARIWSVALAADAPEPLSRMDLTGPTALVLGSEGEGLRPLVRDRCDLAARIPMTGGLDSLSVSASAAISLYEVARQRWR